MIKIKPFIVTIIFIFLILPIFLQVKALTVVDCTHGPWDAPDSGYITDYVNENIADNPGFNDADAREEYARQCKPQRLRGIQPMVVRMIYFVWIASGTVFVVGFMYIGYLYMTSGDNVNKQGEMRQKAIYLVIGIILLFGSQPIATVVMRTVITSTNDCYVGLSDTPGFTFFFSDVCSATALEREICTNLTTFNACTAPGSGGAWCGVVDGVNIDRCFPRQRADWVKCKNGEGAVAVTDRINAVCN